MQRKGCEFTASNWSKYDSGNVATGLQSRWKHFYKNMTLILSLIFHKITKKEKYAIYLKKKKKALEETQQMKYTQVPSRMTE